jgi:hypothetical protein
MATNSKVFVSPGVYTSERDLSFVAQSVGVTTLGIVGVYNRTNTSFDLYVRKPKITKPPSGVTDKILNIDSLTYENYPKSDKEMKNSYDLTNATSVEKQQLDQLNGLNNEVQDISGNVIALQEQVSQLVASQQSYANQMTGGSAPNITGAITPSTSSSSTT